MGHVPCQVNEGTWTLLSLIIHSSETILDPYPLVILSTRLHQPFVHSVTFIPT